MSDSSNVYRLSQARREARDQKAAMSQYGQLRLTVTFAPRGRADYRAMAKRPQDAWTELNVFAAGHERFGTYPPAFSAALEYFALVAEGLRWMPLER